MESCCKSELGSGGRTEEDRCEHCNSIIPNFFDLSANDEKHVRELFESGDCVSATNELMKITGCGLKTAQIWVAHPDGPNCT